MRRSLVAMPVSAVTGVGDVPTQPLEPPASTDVLPVVPPPPLPPRRTPRSPSLLPWIAGLAGAIVLLLVLNALYGGADPAVQARTPAAERSPSPAASESPSTPSPRSPTSSLHAPPPATGSVQEAAAALFGLVDGLVSSGAVEDHLARDLEHGVDKVVEALEAGDGGKALDELGRLQEKVDKGLEHGEISAEDAERLDVAIKELASAVESGDDDEEDEGD